MYEYFNVKEISWYRDSPKIFLELKQSEHMNNYWSQLRFRIKLPAAAERLEVWLISLPGLLDIVVFTIKSGLENRNTDC